MMFKSASVISVLAAVGTLSAYGAPIGYSERTLGRAIAINRDVHQTVAPIAINRDISSSEIARRIVNVTSTDEPHPPPNEKRTGPPGPPGPPGVRPQSPEHYRNMQKQGGPKGGPKGMPKDGPPPSGMDGQSPPPPDFPPPPQNVDGPPGTTPPGFCPCAPSLQPDGNSPVTTPGGDQDKPGDLPPPPPPPPVNPPIGAPSDDNESNPTDDAPNGDGSADGKGPGDVPPPESKPDGVKPPGAPSPADACDDDAPTSTPGDSKKRRIHTRGDQVPTTGNLGKTLGKDLLELNPDDGVLAKAPEPTQRTNESRDDWKRIPPKFIRRHVPPSVLNSYWS